MDAYANTFSNKNTRIKNVTLEKLLLQVWNSLNIDEYYQNIVLSYLDTLPRHLAQQQITKQIKSTHEGNSLYFKLTYKLKQRQKSLIVLSQIVNRANQSNQQKVLEEIAELLSQLRDHNLIISETIINIHNKYVSQQEVSEEFFQILLSLNSDNYFLKECFLKDYIIFQRGYDPYLLHHYDLKGNLSPKLPNLFIDNLFTLSISYVFRLLKAKAKVLKILSSGRNNSGQIKKDFKHVPYRKIIQNIPGKSMSLNKIKNPQQKVINFRIKNLTLQKAKQKQESYLRNIQTQSKQPQDYQMLRPSKFKLPFDKNNRYGSGEIIKLKERPHGYAYTFKEPLQPLNDILKTRKNIDFNDTEPESNQSPQIYRKQLKINIQPQTPVKFTKRMNESHHLSEKSIGRKQLKIKHGKMIYPQLLNYLKQLNIPQTLKNETILNTKWTFSLSKCQSYLAEFIIDNQLRAVALTFVLPQGDYLIKFWGPIANCDEQTNNLLSMKYLEYLESKTSTNMIYYTGNNKQFLQANSFSLKKQNMYMRNRISSQTNKEFEYPQYFSLKCSNITFIQQNNNINLLYSDQIEPFKKNNFYINPAFSRIDCSQINQNLLFLCKVSNNIQDMKALNSLLQDQEFDTYEVATLMKIRNISAIRIGILTNFKTPFIAGDGYIKFNGQQTYRDNQSVICKVQGLSFNSKLIFGKGFQTMKSFVQASQQKQQVKKYCQFSVKMFLKQLYGRIPNENKVCSYGNWEVSLSWKDQLQGRVKHNMINCDHFGLQSFYLGVQIEQQLLLCFCVGNQDFLI